jgi:N-acyl-D-aspartate/D-glutamate deacylase
MPAYLADVAISDGRIARIGRIDEAATRVLDVDGACVTPGFIDIHTHYDVQFDRDPLATPVCYHGVTTVRTGNRGFSLCPAKPRLRASMISRGQAGTKSSRKGIRAGGARR